MNQKTIKCKLTVSSAVPGEEGASVYFEINENLLHAAIDQHTQKMHHRKRAVTGMVKEILFTKLHELYGKIQGLGCGDNFADWDSPPTSIYKKPRLDMRTELVPPLLGEDHED